MALRIKTQAGKFCSSCGVSAESTMELCVGCGQPFEADVSGFVCARCGHAVEANAERCPMCNLELPHSPADSNRLLPPPIVPVMHPPPTGTPSDNPLGKFLELREQVRSDGDKAAKGASAQPEPSEAQLLAELESLWKLSEPFEQVVTSRRKRLEQMDRLIAGARRRIRELEESELSEEVREREELKKQLAQVLQERDEILKIEYGITEMERIYRNIITLQQKELKQKEEALKARLEGFRKEIDTRNEERHGIDSREKGLKEQERNLEEREKAIAARLLDLEARERGPAPGVRADRRGADGVTREEWLDAQREIQQSMMNFREGAGEGALLPPASTVRDLQMRVSELEESIEKIGEEKAGTERELKDIRAAQEEAREVLRVLDDLLGQLPDELIKDFARSEAFARYERLMKRLGL